MERRRGSLTFVGLGIQLAGHVTLAAKGCIEHADRVFYYTADPASGQWLQCLNACATSLVSAEECMEESWPTLCNRMVMRMLEPARKGFRVCVALYGHPSVFSSPTRRAIEVAHDEGIPTRIVPGISAVDCLFADLGIDPAEHGCQIFDASDFVLHRRRFDASSALILYQPATIGHPFGGENQAGVAVLCDYLHQYYKETHEVVLYEAAVYPVCVPLVRRLAIAELGEEEVSLAALLYLPPAGLRGTTDVGWLARLAAGRSLSSSRKSL